MAVRLRETAIVLVQQLYCLMYKDSALIIFSWDSLHLSHWKIYVCIGGKMK